MALLTNIGTDEEQQRLGQGGGSEERGGALRLGNAFEVLAGHVYRETHQVAEDRGRNKEGLSNNEVGRNEAESWSNHLCTSVFVFVS